MKIFIWISCFFVSLLLSVLLWYSTGLKVGGVIFFVTVYFIAKKLCNVWDGYKNSKLIEEQSVIVSENQEINDNKKDI